MRNIKLSNKIFDFGLNPKEMSIYAYLCSLPSENPMFEGNAVKVKQATIAQKCGIKAVQTVSKVIDTLAAKGLVIPLKRSVKQNGHKGTYIYEIKKLPTNDSFFFMDRSVFGKLVPRQMMIYLFICKSYSLQLKDSWNSYNDISAQTGMKRETIIDTISELEQLKLIRKSRRKARDNKRLYVDNHYFLILYVRGKIKKQAKKIARLYCKCNRTGSSLLKSFKFTCYNITKKKICQVSGNNFFESG
ncbi:MAG: helix-turn-helix domain-containing protein [Lachnospiraceae bacterium]|nr:helix-turn-helix domain-containing protein [Lachnospiraceae bacterium]